MAGDLWLWIGFWGMALGFVAIAFLGRTRLASPSASYVTHSFVPVIAATMYLMMALHQGEIALDGGTRLFYFARYIDWSITTPLLLIGLGYTALGRLNGSTPLIAAAVGADILMIVTGFFSGASPIGSIAKWIWYLVSCGAFVAVLYVLWVPLMRLAKARSMEVGRVYTRNAAVLSVLWICYPLVFLGGSEGFNVINPVAILAAFTILDLLAKVAYGLMATMEHKTGQV